MSATAPLAAVTAALKAATRAVASSATHAPSPPTGDGATARARHRATRPEPDPTAAVRPCAKTVRARLRNTDLHELVGRISTGSRWCRIEIDYPVGDVDEAARMEPAERVAAALRPLWHDGAERVTVVWAGAVNIAVSRWWCTAPDTPAGLARLAAEETDRTEAMLAAQRAGKVTAARTLDSVRYEPDPDQPRRPWVDRLGRRYTPFEISAY